MHIGPQRSRMDKKGTYSYHSENDADRTTNGLGWCDAQNFLREVQGLDGGIERGDGIFFTFLSLRVFIHSRNPRGRYGTQTVRKGLDPNRDGWAAILSSCASCKQCDLAKGFCSLDRSRSAAPNLPPRLTSGPHYAAHRIVRCSNYPPRNTYILILYLLLCVRYDRLLGSAVRFQWTMSCGLIPWGMSRKYGWYVPQRLACAQSSFRVIVRLSPSVVSPGL